MKDQYQALADNATRQAIAYDNKEIAATELGEMIEADNHRKLAKYHRQESKKYLEAMGKL